MQEATRRLCKAMLCPAVVWVNKVRMNRLCRLACVGDLLDGDPVAEHDRQEPASKHRSNHKTKGEDGHEQDRWLAGTVSRLGFEVARLAGLARIWLSLVPDELIPGWALTFIAAGAVEVIAALAVARTPCQEHRHVGGMCLLCLVGRKDVITTRPAPGAGSMRVSPDAWASVQKKSSGNNSKLQSLRIKVYYTFLSAFMIGTQLQLWTFNKFGL